MKQFMAFVRKEFFHIFRDRWTTIILLLLPVVMLVLFGYALNTEVKNTHIAVYDPSNDDATREIIRLLGMNDYFVIADRLDSPDQIEKSFQSGKIKMVVVFGNDFYENFAHSGNAQVQLIADGTDPNMALTITNYATRIITAWQQDRKESAGAQQKIMANVKLLYNPGMKAAYNFVPGVMGMVFMLICAMMTSISIAREKETGTMEILLVSPMRPILIIMSKVVPYFFLSCVNLATILLMAVFVLGVPIAGSLFCLVVISLLYIFVSLALGLLISSAVTSQVVALLISGMALMMPVIVLSGMLFPTENMPLALQLLSNIIPAKWFIQAVRKVMIKGLGFSSILAEFGVLSAMAAALVTVSLKNFKTRLE